jgi:colanic acid biosynthesis glycosyl transferase WcaI
MTQKTVVIVSQAYVPDPTSVGQHIADAAAELARRGNRVVVYASARGFGDASAKYPSETRDGVEIRRLPFASLGKASIALRVIGGLSFVIQAALRVLFFRDLDMLVVSTCPPMAPLAALIVRMFRRVRVTYWLMDLNPDQMIAMGLSRPGALSVRLFERLNRGILRTADSVVVLDRFMYERVMAKRDISDKAVILPPWPHDDHAEPVAPADNPFRRNYARLDQIVVMYSGNHSPANPLTTLLDAARSLQHDPRFVFMFIGEGAGKREVEAAGLPNVISLPYQPIEHLRFSLSAADLHVVSVGNGVVGIVHPCKVYGAMAVARPILFVGPTPSHIDDLVEQHGIGWAVRHGDVAGVLAVLETLAQERRDGLDAGSRGRALIDGTLSKAALCGRFCDIVENFESLGDTIQHSQIGMCIND